MMQKLVGIDIGGTKTRVAVVAVDLEEYTIIRKTVENTDLGKLAKQIKRTIDGERGIENISICAPGPMNAKAGILLNPPNLDVKNFKIVKEVEREFGAKASLINDCAAAVVAERFLDNKRNLKNIVYVTLSTGIGAGVILDGKLVWGKDGNAHEVGHMTVDFNSTLRCNCGAYGHWEAYAGGNGIPRYAKQLLETEWKDAHSILRGRKITAKYLFESYRLDRVSAEIVDRISRINAIMVANMINAYDPELVRLGGSIMLNNREILMDGIRKRTALHTINRMPKIEVTRLGDDAGFLGAAYWKYAEGIGEEI
ncbi:MAG: ROK family protein [Candidatus Micrarchaeota archaeon]|nr:ROK family protein [Candidatus Micrarchaeota archaeon]